MKRAIWSIGLSALVSLFVITGAMAAAGGPDTFGYRWIDSDSAGGPTFNWVDITSTGTNITALHIDDGTVYNHGYPSGIPIGFNFNYYGNTYNAINVSTNGWVGFNNSTTSYLSNYPLPSSSGPENVLAVFWDDLDLRSQGDIYYYNDGARFIVEYFNVDRYSSGGPYTFEAILYQNGDILFQYLDMQGARLDEATIGIQNLAKNDGLNVVFNDAYVHNNLAVLFTTNPAPVPEPSTMLLLGSGLVGLVGYGRRRIRK